MRRTLHYCHRNSYSTRPLSGIKWVLYQAVGRAIMATSNKSNKNQRDGDDSTPIMAQRDGAFTAACRATHRQQPVDRGYAVCRCCHVRKARGTDTGRRRNWWQRLVFRFYHWPRHTDGDIPHCGSLSWLWPARADWTVYPSRHVSRHRAFNPGDAGGVLPGRTAARCDWHRCRVQGPDDRLHQGDITRRARHLRFSCAQVHDGGHRRNPAHHVHVRVRIYLQRISELRADVRAFRAAGDGRCRLWSRQRHYDVAHRFHSFYLHAAPQGLRANASFFKNCTTACQRP